MNRKEKVWLENKTGMNNAHNYGMSSALGAKVADLHVDVPQSSSAFDYTTRTLYFFDGVSWN